MSVQEIYDALHTRYGDLNWWPSKTPYEVMVGAVLTQNTAWRNVEKAIAHFGGNLSPQAVLNMDVAELAETIRPAGFFNQKAVYLKAVTAWFAGYNFDVQAVRCEPLENIRAELLSLKGVGKETADSILLYAFGFPSFVVDAYTVRLCERYPIPLLGGVPEGRGGYAGKSYDAVKACFENNLPRDVETYNNFHATIVINAKEHCRKSKPLCNKCPLNGTCKKHGI